MKKNTFGVLVVALVTLLVFTFSACGEIIVGKSAYDIAVENGYSGTVEQWLESLKGQDGSDTGKSAYEVAVENGFEGNVEQWLESLKGKDGEDGKDGANGKNGKDGQNVTIENIYQTWLSNGNEGTFNEFLEIYLSGVVLNDSNSTSVSRAILSVVSVYCTFSKNSYFGVTSYYSGGAGVIYQLDGENGNAYVITNYHVVYDQNSLETGHISSNISLYLYGMHRNEYAIPATFVGGAMTYDIAVLRVEDSEILKEAAAWGGVREVETFDSNLLTVGQTTIAIGNPQAEGISVTQGILSVDSETLTMTGADDMTDIDFRTLRVDTSINEGNSGGGLFDAQGRLIGIVNAKNIESKVEGIGYAIPSNIATFVADNIIYFCDGETVTWVNKCLLGITVQNIASKAVYDPVTQTTHIVETTKIVEVSDNSLVKKEDADDPIQAKAGDIIVSLQIRDRVFEITRQFMVIDAMLTARPGDAIVLTVERNGERVEIATTASGDKNNISVIK